jgi:hypothetical protein
VEKSQELNIVAAPTLHAVPPALFRKQPRFDHLRGSRDAGADSKCSRPWPRASGIVTAAST